MRERAIIYILLVVLLCGCSTLSSLDEGEYALKKVSVVCDKSVADHNTLEEYVRQKPHSGARALFRRARSRVVVYDSLLADQSARDIATAVRNAGYLHARVAVLPTIDGKKVAVQYVVSADEPYYITQFTTSIEDSTLVPLLTAHADLLAPLAAGQPFSVFTLNSVRNKITTLLQDNGYYHFNKDYISFTVDTLAQSTAVGVAMNLYKYRATSTAPAESHRQYRIGSIAFVGDDGGALKLRRSVLESNTLLTRGDLYSTTALRQTYNNFAHLGAVRYTHIALREAADSTLLDCTVQVSPARRSSLSIAPEGTNTAGDLGAALIVGYTNNNIFHGSELFSIELRGAFEAIRGLEGYSDQDYEEYNIETKLTFPRFLVPFRGLRRRSLRAISRASTELALSYNLQDRPEFHRRLFSASWRYRWTDAARGRVWRLDLLEVNYIYMPWISETFREDYLDNNESRNAILRYNYEDLFIMKLGAGVTISGKGYALRANIETAGNFLHALATLTHFPKNEDGQHTLLRIAYAQYVKGDIDYTRTIVFGENSSLALHGALGIAYPYGNSTILPYEKRYFSGGANSVRGWSVRSLGPGRFHGKDGRIDFINQTGDVKIDLNVEYRLKLFWRLHGALFIDAGNIWTLRNYADQEGGQFRFDTFYKELAAAYGLGLRLHLGYFILRFDFGMKAINPDYTTSREHFPIYHPRLSRDLAVHFAVGMPF